MCTAAEAAEHTWQEVNSTQWSVSADGFAVRSHWSLGQRIGSPEVLSMARDSQGDPIPPP